MDVVAYTWWLAMEALRLLFIMWPVSALLLVAAIAMVRLDKPPSDTPSQSLASVLFMFPALSLIWGTLARVEGPVANPALWRIVILALMVVAHIAATAAVVYVSRGSRWKTASLGMLIGWFGLLCAHISRLSVSGLLSEYFET